MQSTAHLLPTCVYLSMNMSALGTLWSPRWITLLPTQFLTDRWAWYRISCRCQIEMCQTSARRRRFHSNEILLSHAVGIQASFIAFSSVEMLQASQE